MQARRWNTFLREPGRSLFRNGWMIWEFVLNSYICLTVVGCSTASKIQRADQSQSAFDGAVYEGQTTILREDIPDSEAYRIFHQAATGFVSVQAVRNSAQKRAKKFCSEKGKAFVLIRESTSVGWHAAGNFPRAELVFACVDEISVRESPEPTINSSNRYDELRELKSLLDEGIITQEEYEQEKGKILTK